MQLEWHSSWPLETSLNFVCGLDPRNSIFISGEFIVNHSELDEKILGKTLIDVLRKTDLFKSLPEESLKTLAENCKQIRIGDEELLCKDGDSGNKMWVILSGKLMVFKLKKMIDVLEPGDFLGEMALIDKLPRSASVRAIGEARLLEIDDSMFKKYILSEPQAMIPFVQGITSRIRHDLDIIVGENQRLSCLVHDMRNYLVPISISENHMENLLILLDGKEGQKKRKGFDELSTAIKKMIGVRDNLITLIDQTLSIRVKSKSDYIKKPVKLFEMVKETTEELAFHKYIKGKTVGANIQESFNKETLCNVLDLKRVLQNLIINAGYASEKGGKIDVHFEGEEDGVKISVVDYGSGIPDDVQPLLLKEIYTSKPDGNGFGLLSCREIVEDYHDGKIGFHSEFGKGATFFFKIPN